MTDTLSSSDITPTRALLDVIEQREVRRATAGNDFDDTLVNGEILNAVSALTSMPNHAPRSRVVMCASFLLAEIERMDRVTAGKDQVPLFAPVSA